MSDLAVGATAADSAPLPLWRRGLRWGENAFVVLPLALMVALPLADIVLRKFTRTGLAGSIPLVQHFTLMVGVVGGAIAARDNRLLSLSPLTQFLKRGWKEAAGIVSHSVAAAVSALLCLASVTLVRSTPADKVVADGVPVWWFQALLPLGFAAVALRLVWNASGRWRWRLLTLALAAGLLWLGLKTPVDPSKLVLPLLVLLLVATILGAPVFTTLGGAAMILTWGVGRTVAALSLDHYELVTNPILPSVPLFTLAGYFLAESGASKRLVRVFQALVGQFRGGPAIVTALICAFFTSFTGASGVTILALGGLLMPVLLAARYSERNALGLVTSAGSLGMLFPPSLPVILYAMIAQSSLRNLELPPGTTVPDVSMNKLFLGGLLPGLLLVGLTAWWGVRCGPKHRAEDRHFDAKEAGRALWDAKWELLLPVVTLVALLGGLATPVEAAAVTALYAFLTQTFVHRDLKLTKDVPRVMTECGLLIGGVLLILGVAMGFTSYLIFAEVPTQGAEWMQRTVHSPWVFLLLLNLFLLIVGCLMDIFSAIVVVVPLIVPMGVAFGVDPIHLGIIFLANLELGFLTPPVGMNLFLSSYRFGKPMAEVTRSVIPMLLVMLVGVLLITYVPALSTWLPRFVK
ncbi:MAG: TRAP transporter large permease subunit [Verrucomicrobia bacterium]|nr:TRAP transporter large permease subunit [Verrucomicrobiota bacterium]